MPTDPDAPGQEPNLELPSFGFGRKKKRGKKSDQPSAETLPETPPEVVSASQPDEQDAGPDTGIETGHDTGLETGLETGQAPARPAAPRAPSAPPAPARAPGSGPTPARPPARPAARPPARPASTPAAEPVVPMTDAPPSAAEAAPVPAQPPAVAPPPVPTTAAGVPEAASDGGDEPTLVDPLQRAAAAMDVPQGAGARRRAAKAERKRSTPGEVALRLPTINPLVAAVLSGVVAGLTTVLLAFGASRGCQAIRGTDSCGGGLGLLAVVAILAIAIVVGAALLKASRISDPFSTSFLGVGVVATIAMLAFLDRINSPWMLLVIPLMTAATFALSWWITVRVIDEHPMSSELDSERGEPDFRGEPQDQDSRA